MPSLACGTEETCVPLSSVLKRNGSEVPKPGLSTNFQKVLGEKNKSTILSRGHQLTRNPDVKFLCVSSSFQRLAALPGSERPWGAGSWVGALGS